MTMEEVKRKDFSLHKGIVTKKKKDNTKTYVFDQYTDNMQNVCKICQKHCRNLLIHMQKSKTCQTKYNMDSLQKPDRAKQKSKRAEAQASYK